MFFKVRELVQINESSGAVYVINGFVYYPGDGTTESTTASHETSVTEMPVTGSRALYFSPIDGQIIASQGLKTSITVNDVYNMYYISGTQNTFYSYIDNARIVVYYLGGGSQTITPTIVRDSDHVYGYDVSFDFTPTKDVTSFHLYIDSILPINLVTGSSCNVTCYAGELNGVGSDIVYIYQEPEEVGLLSGILGWIQNVYHKIVDGFQNMVDAISQLPSLIWGYIEDGLKSLFIPDEQFIVDYEDRWTELLSDRLGAVYQVSSVTIESWDRISAEDAQDTVQMPVVSIPLPGGQSFTFGGYVVKIVPDGFSFLVESVKLIAGIVATVAFVNGLRKRYDEVMGVD